MSRLSYHHLVAASQAGGANTLRLSTDLAAAGGPHVAISPAPRPSRGAPVPAAQNRLIDGTATAAVVIDDNASQIQRVQDAIMAAIAAEHPLLSRVPRLQVRYDGARTCYTDLELPQGIFDAHIVAGSIDGTPAMAHPAYRAARHSSPENARALMQISPGHLVFGVDPASEGHSRFRSALSAEILGVPVEGLSAPPPRPGGDDGVCCGRILRTQVLSFAALRQLRFDCGPAGDEAARALLAAYVLAGVVRANAELSIRSNCDLVENGPTHLTLDARDGQFLELAAPSIDETDELLEHALGEAYREADITWHGQVLQVTGNPAAGQAGTPPAAGASRRFRLPHFTDARRAEAR